MLSKIAFFLALLLFPILLFSQDRVLLEFEAEAERVIWTSSAPTDTPPVGAIEVSARTYEFPIVDVQPTEYLVIRDVETGNLAAKTLKEVGASWKVVKSDFDRVAQSTLTVLYRGQPVEAASVVAKQAGLEIRRTQQGGEPVTFFGLRPGRVDIEVSYNSLEGENVQASGAVDVSLERSAIIPEFAISVTEPTKTTEPVREGDGEPDAATPAEGEQRETEPQPSGGILGQVALILLALAIVGLLLYGAYRWVRANPNQVSAGMKAIGVPPPTDSDGSSSAQPTPDGDAGSFDPGPSGAKTTNPKEQIVLQGGEPEKLARTPAEPTPAAATPTGPALTTLAGQRFELVEGSNVISREPGNAISIASDPSISRKHAEIERIGDRYVLRDFGSTNGTYHNGKKIDAEVELQSGDQVQVGATVLRFLT
ncbi:MAG: FHA domain-containing protein [Fimbriimonadaceae bacterium]